MNTQRALLALALGAGVVAATLYLAAARRVDVVVAAADLEAGRAIGASDVDTRSLPPDAVPAGALRDAALAVGRYARGPIWKGQLVVGDAVGASPAAFDGGVAVPSGYHAVAIPVSAGQALGGAVMPGAYVDVVAVPIAGKAPAGRTTEMIVAAALVIDVRGEQGGPFERHLPARQSATALRDRLGSIVIAVGPSAEMRIADRVATSTFVIALAPERP